MFSLGLCPLSSSNVRNHASFILRSWHILKVRHALRCQHLRIYVQVLLPFFELLSRCTLSEAHHIVQGFMSVIDAFRLFGEKQIKLVSWIHFFGGICQRGGLFLPAKLGKFFSLVRLEIPLGQFSITSF